MTRRILVTRSEPGASETAARLRRRGYAPLVEPLFQICSLAPDVPDFDALAFTSANGVRAFATLSALRTAPVWCVGTRTAEAAREAGYTTVTSSGGDVEDLAAMLRRDLRPGVRLLHAGNADARGDLSDALRQAGLSASFLAVFEAVDAPTGPALAQHLAGAPVLDAVLVHSPRAGRLLADRYRRAKSPAAISVAAISQAAIADLVGIAARSETAQSPNETALLDALDRLLSEG